jgi:hypothetical protein
LGKKGKGNLSFASQTDPIFTNIFPANKSTLACLPRACPHHTYTIQQQQPQQQQQLILDDKQNDAKIVNMDEKEEIKMIKRGGGNRKKAIKRLLN